MQGLKWLSRQREVMPYMARPDFERFARRAIIIALSLHGVLTVALIGRETAAWLRWTFGLAWNMVWKLATAVGIMMLLATVAAAAPCTKGVNCYCDRVQGGDLNDSLLLLCEDWDHPLYRDESTNNTIPGPWWADATFTGNRGFASLFRTRYGGWASGANWTLNNPASPQRGTPCAFGQCSGGPVYHPTGLFGTGQGKLFMVATGASTGDFNSEDASVTRPTGAVGGGTGQFDGNASMAYRIGAGDTSGIFTPFVFSIVRTFGVTMVMAFPSTLLTPQTTGCVPGPCTAGQSFATAIKSAWKFNEWGGAQGGGGANSANGLLGFGYSSGYNVSQFPFYGFIVRNVSAPDSQATCRAKIASATVIVGTGLDCGPSSEIFWFPGGGYNFVNDWNVNTWGCLRGHYQNLGLSNSSIQITLTKPGGTEQTVVHITNLDTTNTDVRNGVQRLYWNHYANANIPNAGSGPTTITTFRYEDSIHVRAGAPVSCSQIGFGASPSDPPPAMPIGLMIVNLSVLLAVIGISVAVVSARGGAMYRLTDRPSTRDAVRKDD